MLPEELLDRLVIKALEKKLLTNEKLPKVGSIIFALNETERDILKTLSSESLLNNRYPKR